jgi:hypothetical protein
MSKLSRRDIVKMSAAFAAANVALSDISFADEDRPMPTSNKFLLYVHFGSSCGIANGLVQPNTPGEWPQGFFQPGAVASAVNPLLNSHTKAGNHIFHDYLKWLAPMTDHMCLVNGNSQSLDHGVAARFQMRGHELTSAGAEWGMGVTQNMKGFKSQNPMIISSGTKSHSVTDITAVNAGSVDTFKNITSDSSEIPKGKLDPIWAVLAEQYKKPGLTSVKTDESLGGSMQYQLNTLTKGLPELAAAQADINALNAGLTTDKIKTLVAPSAENAAIVASIDNNMRNQLVLAGILAKTGLANGMTISVMGEDTHFGGSDVGTARLAAGKWALISLFWDWVKSANLQNDITIVVSQEFARSPYNKEFIDQSIVDATGATKAVRSFGRDHGLSMGMMFINANVPKSGRIGTVSSNLTPMPSKDIKGTVDSSGTAYVSANIVGSMLLRLYPDLFPTERMVRKHWPSFIEIPLITA